MDEKLDRLGRRVELRRVEEQDLEAFYHQQRDPEANQMAGFPPRDREAHLAHWHEILADETVTARTVTVDGEVAGNVVRWVDEAGSREVGIWLDRRFWDRGVGTAALEEFLPDAGPRPLFAHVAAGNAASRRMLEKCGFWVVGSDDEEVLLRLD